jgi:hypothetical protein
MHHYGRQENNMKRILCAALMAVIMATPAFAAKLYLKDGGVIKAKRVWRSDGRVYVLATRHTMTSFDKSEVNMKRTFPKQHRSSKRIAAVTPPSETVTAAPNGAAAIQKPVDKKAGIALPNLPKLPEKTPESLVPSTGGAGSIKQHKKEMADRVGE